LTTSRAVGATGAGVHPHGRTGRSHAPAPPAPRPPTPHHPVPGTRSATARRAGNR